VIGLNALLTRRASQQMQPRRQTPRSALIIGVAVELMILLSFLLNALSSARPRG